MSVKYICDRCDNLQAEKGETDKPMHSVTFPQKTLHLCKKCQEDFVTLKMTISRIRYHLFQNCINLVTKEGKYGKYRTQGNLVYRG